jgi:hypothetical protein
MASNTLTTLLPKILARALLALRSKTVMPALVNTDYSTEAKKKGSTIDIPVPSAVGTRAVAPSSADPTDADDNTPETVQLQLNNWRQTDPFYLSDQDLTNIDADENFLPMQLSAGVESLGAYVNSVIFAAYTGVYGFAGTPGVTPFDEATPVVDTATEARKVLNQQKCPRDNRRGVLDYDAEAAALALPSFSHASKVGDNSVIRQGNLGTLFGFDWYSDGQVPTHTLGMAGIPLVDDGAGIAVGIEVIHMDGFTTKPSVGDIFTTATRASGAKDLQTYVVTSSSTLAGTDSDIGIAPPLQVALAAGDDSSAITFKASHVVNLAFHRDAFAFASRPMMDTDITNEGNMLTMADPVSKLVLRLEVKRQHKRTSWELDILFGAKLIRPELACRIAG